MTAAVPAARRTILIASWAVFAVFFLNGFNFSSWVSRMPAVRDSLAFTEAQMGLLLLFAAMGSIVALPLSGLVVQRIGASKAVAGFAVLNVAGLVTAVTGVAEGSPLTVRIGLVATGVGTGVWDAAMNLEGAAVEQQLGKAIMPRFHAGFSFGTMGGAGLGVLLAALGVPIQWHLVAALAVSIVAVLWCVRYFLPAGAHDAADAATHVPAAPAADAAESGVRGGAAARNACADDAPGSDPSIAVGASASDSRARGALQAWTEPRTLLIGLVVLAAALTEGAANDWVALAVVDGFGTSDATGAAALAVFLTAMTGMRLLGTGLLDRYGRVAILRASAGLALVGLAIFTLVPNVWLSLVGIVAWGMGAALGFPVGMSAASDDPARAAVRVSVVATIGYSAFFMGPPLIGFLAEHVGYRQALLAIAVPVVVGLMVVGAARPLSTAAGHAAVEDRHPAAN